MSDKFVTNNVPLPEIGKITRTASQASRYHGYPEILKSHQVTTKRLIFSCLKMVCQTGSAEGPIIQARHANMPDYFLSIG
jgi:hypothetical protein